MSAPVDYAEITWKKLCGLAVSLCGSQDAFRREANVLKRLVKGHGPAEVERMILGAQAMDWRSLVGLGSADGLGRRLALARYWQDQNHRPAPLPKRIRDVLRQMVAP